MSREILFKAKRLDNGEWVEGDLLHLPHGVVILANGYANIVPETICQYTGLTDKNGKKIWEKDVVTHSYTVWANVLGNPPEYEIAHKKKNYVIKWDCTASYMGYRYHNGRNIFPFKLGTVINGDDEVIGNIFDNPELLRGEDDEQTD